MPDRTTVDLAQLAEEHAERLERCAGDLDTLSPEELARLSVRKRSRLELARRELALALKEARRIEREVVPT